MIFLSRVSASCIDAHDFCFRPIYEEPLRLGPWLEVLAVLSTQMGYALGVNYQPNDLFASAACHVYKQRLLCKCDILLKVLTISFVILDAVRVKVLDPILVVSVLELHKATQD